MSSSSKHRKKYLHLTPLEQAVEMFLQHFRLIHPLPEEIVDINEALNRVTSRPIFAMISSPFFRASAMDGYAVRSTLSSEANEAVPTRLMKGRDVLPVDTGDPIPQEFDSVIQIEDVHEIDDEYIEITKSVPPGQNIRESGEDIVESDMLFPTAHIIRPQDIGCILAAGCQQVPVRKRPVVTIIPTGSEIVSLKGLNLKDLHPGSIIDSSSSMLKAFIESNGGTARITKIIPDEILLLEGEILKNIPESDLVLIIAGSSAGREDYTASILGRIGRLYTHGLAIAPGKPTILSSVADKPCIGMPGYPVSSLIVSEYVIKPLIHQMVGLPPAPSRLKRIARLSSPLPSRLGVEEFVRVGLGRSEDKLIAVPYPKHASALSTYVHADGIARIPRLSEGIAEGTDIEVELIVPEERLEKTLIHQGSHDMCLNILQDILWKEYGILVSSFNIGSLGGLYALKKYNSHLAGCHLLDPNTGSYNAWATKQYLPDFPVKIVHLAFREQGFIVAKGNPLHIEGLHDISRNNIKYINRQNGSGTRILLDYLLNKSGISTADVLGYSREEFTHLAVASQVASGSADAGLGLRASAQALGLDFIPLAREEYDLIIPESLISDERIQTLISVLKTEGFRSRARSLGGYDISRSGEVIPL